VGEIGDRLREARENKDLTLEQAQEGTRIRRAFLQALEEERFDQLPADVYARGFLRNYARFLGLDPEPLLKAYRSPRPAPAVRLPEVLDEPLSKGSAGSIWRALFWVLVIAAIVGLGLWYGYREFYLGTAWGAQATPSAIAVATLAEPTATAALSETEETPTATDEPTAEPTPTMTIEPTATQGTGAASAASPSASPTRTAEATSGAVSPSTTAASGASATPGAEGSLTPTGAAGATMTASRTPTPSMPATEDGIPVVVQVVDRSYVHVMVDGTKVLEAILEPGDRRVWAFKSTFSMRVGNAGGLRVTLNGVEMPPLGKVGQVLNVDYRADDLPMN